MIRVLLVDDDRLVCAHLRTILGAADDIEVVGESYDGREAVQAVRRLRPDVVLIDLRMPVLDGIGAIEQITRLHLGVYLIVLTTFDVDALVVQALRAGASGYLLKSTAPADFVALIRAAAGGHSVLSPQTTARLVAALGPAVPESRGLRAALGRLTPREIDVLRKIASGQSNIEIADALSLSEATVKGHVSRILDKLECRNRTQAGLLAHQYLDRPAEPSEGGRWADAGS